MHNLEASGKQRERATPPLPHPFGTPRAPLLSLVAAARAKRKVYIESRLGCAVDVAALLKL